MSWSAASKKVRVSGEGCRGPTDMSRAPLLTGSVYRTPASTHNMSVYVSKWLASLEILGEIELLSAGEASRSPRTLVGEGQRLAHYELTRTQSKLDVSKESSPSGERRQWRSWTEPCDRPAILACVLDRTSTPVTSTTPAAVTLKISKRQEVSVPASRSADSAQLGLCHVRMQVYVNCTPENLDPTFLLRQKQKNYLAYCTVQ